MAQRSQPLRLLFRAAAGPRMGYGHLVRATVLARECGVESAVVLRGGAAAVRTARRLGCRVVRGSVLTALRTIQPDVLVIDDPSPVAARRACRSARRHGTPVASVHDLGLGYCAADLTIDGSVAQPHGTPVGPALVGPRFAILAGDARGRVDASDKPSVLVALGGGPRASVACAIARTIAARHPEVRIRVAGGFGGRRSASTDHQVSWLGPRVGLADELARASVAVVGGGVTLYEACATGTPAVGVAVVQAQQPTIRGFAAKRAVCDGGTTREWRRVPAVVSELLTDAAARQRLGRRGRALVDGRGAARVARALVRLAASRPSAYERGAR